MLKTVLALSLLLSVGIGVKSSAAGECAGGQGNCQKQRWERWKIMQDQQTKIQKTVAPKGGSTGPTVPPKPTRGNKN